MNWLRTGNVSSCDAADVESLRRPEEASAHRSVTYVFGQGGQYSLTSIFRFIP